MSTTWSFENQRLTGFTILFLLYQANNLSYQRSWTFLIVFDLGSFKQTKPVSMLIEGSSCGDDPDQYGRRSFSCIFFHFLISALCCFLKDVSVRYSHIIPIILCRWNGCLSSVDFFISVPISFWRSEMSCCCAGLFSLLLYGMRSKSCLSFRTLERKICIILNRFYLNTVRSNMLFFVLVTHPENGCLSANFHSFKLFSENHSSSWRVSNSG